MKTQKVFDNLAMKVFESYSISRDGEIFELAEIEIYLIDPLKNINDMFIHQHADQMKYEHLYFHYSGVDICLGDKSNGIYCGVLVRGISNEEQTIYGPGRVAYERPTKDIKRQRSLAIKNRIQPENLVFSDQSNSETELSKIVFKLPRVNLSTERIVKYSMTDKNNIYMYLNLKARYIRLYNENFSSPKKTAPAELREVFNAYLEYKIEE